MKEHSAVIGCGRWGTFLAWYLSGLGEDVALYGRSASPHFTELRNTGKNSFVTLPETVHLTSDLAEAMRADTLFISIGSQNLRGFLREAKPLGIEEKTLVLCMKGLEQGTGMRLSEVVRDVLGEKVRLAVWVGPGHIQDFVRGVPNCMVLDSRDADLKHTLAHRLSGELIRFYEGTDLASNELGAAAKNVYGIGAGILDALGYGSLKGAFLVRSCVEVARLFAALGAEPKNVYGLCFLGECETTFFSSHSHNKRFGEKFIRGEAEDTLCEGIYTLEVLHRLAEEKDLDLPICRALYDFVIAKKTSDPETLLASLFARSLKKEF